MEVDGKVVFVVTGWVVSWVGVGVGYRGQRVCRARIWQEKIGDQRGMPGDEL